MVRSLFSIAVETAKERVRAKGKSVHFELFDLYDPEECTGESCLMQILPNGFKSRLQRQQLSRFRADGSFANSIAEARELTASDDEFAPKRECSGVRYSLRWVLTRRRSLRRIRNLRIFVRLNIDLFASLPGWQWAVLLCEDTQLER